MLNLSSKIFSINILLFIFLATVANAQENDGKTEDPLNCLSMCKTKDCLDAAKETNVNSAIFEKISKMKIDRVNVAEKIRIVDEKLRRFQKTDLSDKGIDFLSGVKKDLEEIKSSYNNSQEEYTKNYESSDSKNRLILMYEWCKFDSVTKPGDLDDKFELLEKTIKIRIATQFSANVEGWKGLAPNLNALAETSERLLIFDEGQNQQIWNIIINTSSNILSLGGGALTVKFIQEQKYSEAALSVLGVVGINVLNSYIQSNLFSNQNFDALVRNIAFNDEIRSILKLSNQINKKIKELDDSILESKIQNQSTSKVWMPKEEQIQDYNKILTLLDSTNTIITSMRNKTEYLLSNYSSIMSEKGKISLTTLKQSFIDSEKDWAKTKYRYAKTYDILLEYIK